MDSEDGGLGFGEQGSSAASPSGHQVIQASCSRLLILLTPPATSPFARKGLGRRWLKQGWGWGRPEGMAGRHASQENGKGLGGWGRAWFCGSVFAQPAYAFGSGGPAAPTVKPVQLVRLGIPGHLAGGCARAWAGPA